MAEIGCSGVRGARGVRKTTRERVRKTAGQRVSKSASQRMSESASERGGESASEQGSKKGRGNGLERLKRAVNRRLKRESEALADLLLDKAKEGKIESVRLMVNLAERKKKVKPEEKKKKRREGPSWAELLASEPEWEAPNVGDVWIGDGWKKPSGEIVMEGEIKDELGTRN